MQGGSKWVGLSGGMPRRIPFERGRPLLRSEEGKPVASLGKNLGPERIWGRLKEPLVSYLANEGKRAFISRESTIVDFFKEARMSRHWWKDLREGKPVPWELVQEFVK